MNPGPFTCKANALPLSYIPLIDIVVSEPHKSEIEELLGEQVCETKAFNWTNQVMSNNSESNLILIQSIYALPTLLFGFECHGTMLPIYCDLRRKEHEFKDCIMN